MGSKIPADRIYHSDKVLAGIPQLLDDFSQLIDDQETGTELKTSCNVSENNFMNFFSSSFAADVVFLLGREEERVYAHRLILAVRCKSFQMASGGYLNIFFHFSSFSHKFLCFQGSKRGSEICRIPGSTVLPSPAGTATLIRLPHINYEDFKQFIAYVYSAKIMLHDSKVFQVMK